MHNILIVIKNIKNNNNKINININNDIKWMMKFVYILI